MPKGRFLEQAGVKHNHPLMNFKSHLAFIIAGVDILVAADTEGMVQKTRGHEGFLSSLKFDDVNAESLIAHFFSTPGYANPE
jgi:hypothetical protein